MGHPETKAREIVKTLQDAGHEAYFAGGSVRDELLGLKPKDYDIATSAVPDVVERLFRRTLSVGKQFGVIVVLMGQESFDVATFRTDVSYSDGRHPEAITFTSAKEDVARRDFTINGLLKDPVSGEIHDYVGGRADLEAGLIRTIGSPRARFGEDHLRMLRAIRFAGRLEFELEAETRDMLLELASNSALPSAERIGAELEKMLTEGHPSRSIQLLEDCGLLRFVLPSLAQELDRTVAERLCVDGEAPATVRDRLHSVFGFCDGMALTAELAWAHLFSDLSAGSAVSRGRLVGSILKNLRASNETCRTVAQLVRVRDRVLFATRISRARRTAFLAHEQVDVMCEFASVQGRFSSSDRDFDEEELTHRPLPDPLLRGNELMELGVERGRRLGRVVKQLRFRQLDGICKSRADAESFIRSIVS